MSKGDFFYDGLGFEILFETQWQFYLKNKKALPLANR